MKSALYKDPRDVIGPRPDPSFRERQNPRATGRFRLYVLMYLMLIRRILQDKTNGLSRVLGALSYPCGGDRFPEKWRLAFFCTRGSQSDRFGTCEERGHAKHFESYAAPPSPTAEGDLRLPSHRRALGPR